MYGTMALPRSVESPNSLCSQPGVDNVRHHTLPQNPDAYHAQRLALRKQCTAYYQHGRDLTSPNQQPQQPYLFADQYQRRLDYSPARREYERCAIPEERGLDESALRRIGDRSRSCDRYPRTLSPVSRFANTPSPLPRSLSRGSSRSCQSSSADESGREGGGGGASSSGIGLSGSSANSSRRASCCSSGTGSSRLTYHSNAVTLIGSNLSRDSINSRIYSGTPELTVKDVTPRSAAGDQAYYEESEQDQSARDDGDLKSSEPHCPQSMDSLENELTCPICLDLFHEPVLLPCAHNLCSGCVEQFFATHGGNLSETPGSRVVFQCPTCREIVALDSRGVSALRRNLTLQNIVDSYRRAAATSPGARRNEFEDISDEESSASNISTQSDGSLGPSRSRRRMRHKELESKDYVHINGPATKLEVTTIQQPADEVVLCQFCDLEPARAAVKTCLTCRAYYCDRCLRVTHPRKKPFVNHKLVAATPGSAGTLSANHSTAPRQRTHATCFNHANEVADLYCANCELSLCKICSLATEHGNHVIHNVNDWCQKRKSELEHHVTGMTKQRAEVERIMNLFAEARQETENNAAAQDAKLQAECDTLIRIVNERREAIAAKIKETKGNRMRRLSQSLQAGKQCMESLDAAIAHASDIAQQEQNTARMVKDSKITTERINQALSSAKLVSTQAEALANPGFYLDFTQEKTLLDKLDILEAPAVPRICEELCTQSHDKVTIQWRSSDARHTEWYELQYAIDDRWSTPESPTDGWMIVPNIKESSYTIHGMQTGTRYVFAVKAVNKAGSTRSEIVTIKTLGMPFAFDTHSMHKKLRLANHGYTVSREDSNKKSKDSGSSSSLCGVSGNVSIEGGRHYWEVVVCQSTSFTLGVAYTNAPRFEWTGKNNMSWCLCRSNQEWSVRHDSKDIPVHLPSPFPKKIGVLLDYDTGVLSFFDGASGRRIHTFRIDFKRAIRPAFSVGNKSLTINTGITVPDQLQLPVESIYN